MFSLIAKVKPILGQATDELLAGIELAKALDPAKFKAQEITAGSPLRLVCHERGILVLKNSQSSSSGTLCMLCKAVVPFSAASTFDILRNLAHSPEIDSLLHSVEILERVDEETLLLHLVYKGEKCHRDDARDFCVIFHTTRVSPGKYRILIKSLLSSRARELFLCPRQTSLSHSLTAECPLFLASASSRSFCFVVACFVLFCSAYPRQSTCGGSC